MVLFIVWKWSWMASKVCHPWMWWMRKIRPFNVTVSFLRFPSLESTITTIPPPQVSTSFLNVPFAPILCIPQFIRFLPFSFSSISAFWSVSLFSNCGSVVRGSLDSLSICWLFNANLLFHGAFESIDRLFLCLFLLLFAFAFAFKKFLIFLPFVSLESV